MEQREEFWRERWGAALQASYRTLGMGYATLRAGIALPKGANGSAGRSGGVVEPLTGLASSEEGRKMLAEARALLREKYPEIEKKYRASFEELERGRTKNIQLLEDIRQAAGPLPLSTLDPSLVAIGLLSRGLLGVVHAELNLSYREAARRRDAVPTLGLIEELNGHMRQLLLDGERKLHAALLAAAPAAVLIEQARSFAASIEAGLPGFARAQGRVIAPMRRRLESKSGRSRLVSVARAMVEAGALTREALAAQAACYLLERAIAQGDEGVDLADAAAVPFEGTLPAGRVVTPETINQAADGEYVTVEGFVAAVSTSRDSDRKLKALVELFQPGSSKTIVAAAVYTHLAHLGVAKGGYCRLSGEFRQQSKLFGQKAAVEIDRMSLKDLSASAWRFSFLNSASDIYRRWPNGLNMEWSLAPHRRVKPGSGTSYYGAGEVLYPPLVRAR